jgi:hypothetical protein
LIPIQPLGRAAISLARLLSILSFEIRQRLESNWQNRLDWENPLNCPVWYAIFSEGVVF